MPEYEFVCEQCKKPFAKTMSISEYEKTKFKCPNCKSKKVTRQVSVFQTKTSRKS